MTLFPSVIGLISHINNRAQHNIPAILLVQLCYTVIRINIYKFGIDTFKVELNKTVMFKCFLGSCLFYTITV
jgi:hypothetical protein